MMTARAGLLAFALLANVTVANLPHAHASESSQASKPAFDLKAAHARALDLAGKGNVKGAIIALRSAIASTPIQSSTNHYEMDRAELSLGRLLYENGEFEQAIDAYEKVQKGGPSWLEAIEEEAWAEFRRDRPEVAIARLKTVTSPAFKDKTRSEPFFLMGLAQLRVCDYKSVFKTIDLFKNRFREKTRMFEASKSAQDKAQLNEIGESVQKLNIVEAEAIQRLYLDENGKPRKGSPPSVARTVDQLSFPATDGDDEVWMDEIDGYRVTLKGCVPPVSATGQIARRDAPIGVSQKEMKR